MNNIRDAIRRMALEGQETACKVCTVDAIDQEARTVDCTPIDESAPLLGVNLQANQQSSWGVVAFPRVGSYIVVGFVAEGNAAVVLATDDIESLEVVISQDTSRIRIDQEGVNIKAGNDIKATITPSGIELNGGKLGGLVKLKELEDNLQQLKDYVEAMNSAISPALKAIGTGTAASGTAGSKAYDAAMASRRILLKSMENEKIKQ